MSSSWTKSPNPWTPELEARGKQYHKYADYYVKGAVKQARERVQDEKDRYREIKSQLPEERRDHISREHMGLPAQAQVGIAAEYKNLERRHAQTYKMRSSVIEDYPYAYEDQMATDRHIKQAESNLEGRNKARKNKEIRMDYARCEEECYKRGYP